MDKPSERLIRSTLHDLANVLAGVRGLLDLTGPDRPLGPANHARMEAVVEEGLAVLGRSRHLALGTLPDDRVQEGPDWRAQLSDGARPLGIVFRCPIQVEALGGGGPDLWPGAQLRELVLATIRQVLPYAKEGPLLVRCRPGADAWTVELSPAGSLPESLRPGPEDARRDISSQWAVRLALHLGAVLSCENGTLTIRVPRA